MIRSPDGDTDRFAIIAGVSQWDTLATFLLIICLDDALRTLVDLMKENCFTLKSIKYRRYLAETITDSDSADDLVLLTNTPVQVESSS